MKRIILALALAGCNGAGLSIDAPCTINADCGPDAVCMHTVESLIATQCPHPPITSGVCRPGYNLGAPTCINDEIDRDCVLICADDSVYKIN